MIDCLSFSFSEKHLIVSFNRKIHKLFHTTSIREGDGSLNGSNISHKNQKILTLTLLQFETTKRQKRLQFKILRGYT